MANSQHKYLLERGWTQQQIDEVVRKAHEWLRGAGYTPLTEQGHWNGIMGNTQSYHLPSKEKDARGMTEAFVEMLKGGKILDASRVHKFSRPGAPDTFAVEDRFYFGKGRKERFASISIPKQSVTSGASGTWKKREVTVRGKKAWLVELYRGSVLVGYLNQHPDTRQFHAFDGNTDQQIGVGSESEMKRLVESL